MRNCFLALLSMAVVCAGSCKETKRQRQGLSNKDKAWILSLKDRKAGDLDRWDLRQLTWKAASRRRSHKPWKRWLPLLKRLLERTPQTDSYAWVDRDLLRTICPAMKSDVIDKLVQPANGATYYPALWKKCAFGRLKLIKPPEYGRWPGLSLRVLMLYYYLHRVERLSDPIARRLCRAWIREHPRISAGFPDVGRYELPKGSSQTPLLPAVDLHIGKLRFSLRYGEQTFSLDNGPVKVTTQNWRKAGEQCPGSPRGCFPHLYVALKRVTGRHPAWGFPPLAIFADRRTQVALLKRVVHTAGHAGFKVIQLVTRGPNGEPQVNLLRLPWPSCPPNQAPGAATASGTNVILRNEMVAHSRGGAELRPIGFKETTLVIKRDGYQIPFAGGRVFTSLPALVNHLWSVFTETNRYDSAPFNCLKRSIRIVAEKSISYEKLIQVLDAIRHVPLTAKNPVPKMRPWPFGCQEQIGPARRHFYLPESSEKRNCLYYNVSLALESP